MSLIEYIVFKYNGSQTAFAKAQNVKLPQVTQWIKKDFIVVDNVLYSKRRVLS